MRAATPRFSVSVSTACGFIRSRKGQRWSHDQRSGSTGRRATPAAGIRRKGHRRSRRPHAGEYLVAAGVGGQVHPRRGAVVGADRRIPDPDRAAGVHPAEHRLHDDQLLRLGVESARGRGDSVGGGVRWPVDGRRRHRADRSIAPRSEEELQGRSAIALQQSAGPRRSAGPPPYPPRRCRRRRHRPCGPGMRCPPR